MTKKAHFVVIGGGTGSFSVLSGLRGQVSDISAIVGMADDGGSTGILRDELGVLPPGDVRQCLVALSDAPEELRQLFNFRFDKGSFEGHPFGNLFLSATEKMTGSFDDAIRMASEVLSVKGKVIPITLDNVRLAIEWPDGTVTQGEGEIDVMDFGPKHGVPKLYLKPSARINPAAVQAIGQADLVVIAPGDLYTSLGALLIVDGVGEALANRRGKMVYVSNLVVKPGQTTGFTVADHAAEIERFMGGPYLDAVIYNTQEPDKKLLEQYVRARETPVEIDMERLLSAHYKVIGRPLISNELSLPPRGDPLAAHRSYIRHDSDVLAQTLLSLVD
jgi:uncharacterized cofD-like protein